MSKTTCHACHRYELQEVQEVQDVNRHVSPNVPCCFRHRHPDRASTADGCQGYRPWLQVAQEVLHRHVRTLYEELDDPRHGYRSLFGSLNRQGHDLLARIQELEALLGQSEAIPLTTAKPRQFVGTKTPSVPVYVEVLREMLAK